MHKIHSDPTICTKRARSLLNLIIQIKIDFSNLHFFEFGHHPKPNFHYKLRVSDTKTKHFHSFFKFLCFETERHAVRGCSSKPSELA